MDRNTGIPDMRFINRKLPVADIARALDLRFDGASRIHCWHPERHKNGDSAAHSGWKLTREPEVSMILLPTTPREEILRTWGLLVAPGDIHEVRIPKAGHRGTISGYFDSLEALADAVLPLDGTVPAIYVTLNPCNPALLARAANRLRERAETTTSDSDILRRRWLLLDFDPVRPAGISASDKEHGRAMTVACGAWDDLRSQGFGDPGVADSGNGAHLLYPVDLPNDQAAADRVKFILERVGAYCGTEDIAVDRTVYNAARIVKVYGTMACKGDSVPGRPHRRSRLLEVPDRLGRLVG